MNKQVLWLACMLLSSIASFAQTNDSTLYRVETKDGNEYVGYIVWQDADEIRLQTERLGTISIKKIDIRQMRPASTKQIKSGELWFENPQSTRYLWQPNGYGLKRGEAYFQNVWVFFNQLAFGMTDNFSIGGGVMPLFLIGGLPTPVWVNPKLSIPVVDDQVNIGAGALMGTILGENEANFGIVYGISTLGNKDRNFSLGVGYGYAGGDWARRPTITASAMIRTSARGYFLTENYFIGTAASPLIIASVGGRRMIKSTGLDFGFFHP